MVDEPRDMPMTSDSTSTGMPSIATAHDALDIPPVDMPSPSRAAQSLLGEGKTQLSSSLGGLAEAVHDIATKLEGNGAAPLANYVHDAADAVHGWSRAVDAKSIDDLVGDARSLVRSNPALAIGLAVAAGFVVARVVRSGR